MRQVVVHLGNHSTVVTDAARQRYIVTVTPKYPTWNNKPEDVEVWATSKTDASQRVKSDMERRGYVFTHSDAASFRARLADNQEPDATFNDHCGCHSAHENNDPDAPLKTEDGSFTGTYSAQLPSGKKVKLTKTVKAPDAYAAGDLIKAEAARLFGADLYYPVIQFEGGPSRLESGAVSRRVAFAAGPEEE